MYTMKFMFDWGSGVCLWSTNKAAEDKFGDYPILTTLLPVSDNIKNDLEHLIEWHDEALNWADPASELLWDEKQIQEFLVSAKKIYLKLCKELGEEYKIEFVNQL